jgi:hypothetical protein
VSGRPPPIVMSGAAFAGCVTRRAGASRGDDPWARCVLDGVSARPPAGRDAEVVG